MAENRHSESGTSLALCPSLAGKPDPIHWKITSTEGLLTAQYATVQQIRLAAHLTDLAGFKPHNSFHLYIPFPTFSYLMFEGLFSSPGSTSRDASLFLLCYESIPCCPWRWPMTTALSKGSKAQAAHAVSAMPPSQRKIQEVFFAPRISTQTGSQISTICGLPQS